MKTISASMLTHLGQEVTTLTTCWKITLTNGSIKAFTGLDMDIVVAGITYKATTGFSSSGVPSAGASINSIDIKSFIDDVDITETDILSGLYDGAKVEMFKVNWNDLTGGTIVQQVGWIGDVSVEGDVFVAEVRGRGQNLKTKLGQLYSPTCRALLGDARCTVNLTPFKVTSSVNTVSSNTLFGVASLGGHIVDYFKKGKIIWSSGLNAGITTEINTNPTTSSISLLFSPPFAISIGDTLDIYPGCDKSIATCRDVYSNIVNFRGEPYIPNSTSIVAPLSV